MKSSRSLPATADVLPASDADDLAADWPLLASLRGPADLERLHQRQFVDLAHEIRSFLIDTVSRTGGHLGAGLGVVELTLALFAEFDFNDRDKLVWDVGHQVYPHKVLTGRARQFPTLRQWHGMSGFPDPAESPFDTVKTGHGGTSISTAMGYALSWAHQARDERRHAIAVIGDGSLQEGQAYEALNHAGTFDKLPLVVVLNDNGISISPSVGALDRILAQFRNGARDRDDIRMRDFFAELGFSYFGPIDGHDIERLRMTFRTVRHWRRPVLVHVVTKKGKGYRDDVPERTGYHAHGGNGPKKVVPPEFPQQGGETFSQAFTEQAISMAEVDPKVHVITAAMLEGTGLVPFQERFPDRCHDAGMAEQHAVGLAAAMALAGDKPICAIYSTFLQRAYDQMFQEVALQKAKVLFCMDRGGLVGSDGATHHGIFDIAYLRVLPNFALLAPRDTTELRQMMQLFGTWDGPLAIRFPRGAGPRPEAQLPVRDLPVGKGEELADGDAGVLVGYGTMAYLALELRRRIEDKTGKRLAVINARCAKPLDAELIGRHWREQPLVVTLEDHVVAGGFGAAVAELGLSGKLGRVDLNRLAIFGLPDRFIDHGERIEQLTAAGLDADGLERQILARIG